MPGQSTQTLQDLADEEDLDLDEEVRIQQPGRSSQGMQGTSSWLLTLEGQLAQGKLTEEVWIYALEPRMFHLVR